MKVSISLPDGDVQFLDQYVLDAGLESRSAALQKAVRLLRTAEVAQEYAAAWEVFDPEGDAAIWDEAVADGLDRERSD